MNVSSPVMTKGCTRSPIKEHAVANVWSSMLMAKECRRTPTGLDEYHNGQGAAQAFVSSPPAVAASLGVSRTARGRLVAFAAVKLRASKPILLR